MYLNPTDRPTLVDQFGDTLIVPGVATIIGAKDSSDPLTFDVTGRQPDGSVAEGPAGEFHTDADPTLNGIIRFGNDEKFTSIGASSDTTGSVGSLLSVDGVPDAHAADNDGSLLFRANGGLFYFSDVNIDGSLFVHGNTIDGDGRPDGVNGFGSGVIFNNLDEHQRQRIQFDRDVDPETVDQDDVLDTDDTRFDQGMDIVARDEIRFTGSKFLTDPNETGNLNVDPQFALLDPDGFSVNLFFRGYIIRILPDFDLLFADTTVDIHGSGTGPAVRDLHADGPSITDQSPGVPSDMEDVWFERYWDEDRWDVVDPKTNPTAAMIDQLREMGVYARPYSEDELVGQLTSNILDDTPQTLNPQPQDYTIVERRIDYNDAETVLDLFEQLQSQDSVSADDLRAVGVQLQQMGLTRREIRNSLDVLSSMFNVGVSVDQLMPEDRDPMPQSDDDASEDEGEGESQ
jgi:hypothetical protein